MGFFQVITAGRSSCLPRVTTVKVVTLHGAGTTDPRTPFQLSLGFRVQVGTGLFGLVLPRPAITPLADRLNRQQLPYRIPPADRLPLSLSPLLERGAGGLDQTGVKHLPSPPVCASGDSYVKTCGLP